MGSGILLVVSGPAGVGKGTVVKKLLENSEYVFSVSLTTRLPRPGESDGVNYSFVTKKEFLGEITSGRLLEHAEYVGNYYGTPRGFVEKSLSEGKNVVLEIDPAGALMVKSQKPEAVLVFVAPPSLRQLAERLEKRGTEDKVTIKKRLETAKRELEQVKSYDYVVVNDKDAWEETAEKINCIVNAEKLSVKRGIPDF